MKEKGLSCMLIFETWRFGKNGALDPLNPATIFNIDGLH